MRAFCVVMLVACGGKATPTAAPVNVVKNERLTEAQLDEACNRKRVDACVEIGERYWGAEGVDADRPRASQYFKRACEMGDQDSCAWYAGGIAQGYVPGEKPEAAYVIFEKACNGGEQRGCRGIGWLKYEGKGTAKDIDGAEVVLTKACAKDDGMSCGLLAVLMLNDRQNPEKAREHAKRGCDLEASFACFVAAYLVSDDAETYRLLERACELGDAEACTTIGATLLAAPDVKHDGPKAIRLLDRGCALGSERSCRALGGALLTGVEGVPADDTRAAKALLKSCDGGDLSGCAVLGLAYAAGRGIAKDVTKAVGLFRKACDEGTTEATATGCYYLALSHSKGEGVTKSDTEAAKYFGIACDRSWGEACAALADQYENGRGVKADKDKAAEYNYRACEMNFVASCMKDRKRP